MLTAEQWSGTVNGRVEHHINDAWEPSETRVDGQLAASYAYDRDSLVTSVNDLRIDRDPESGLITGTEIGRVQTRDRHNGFGELVQREWPAT